MSELDEISTAIGELRSDFRYTRQWFDQHEAADQKRFEALAARIDKANGYNDRLTCVETTITEYKSVTEGLSRVKWIGLGILLTGSLAGGAAANVFGEIIKFLQ